MSEVSEVSNSDIPKENNLGEDIDPENQPLDYQQEDQLDVQSQPNFWIDGNFKRTTRRIEDGARTTEEILRMIQERAEIENVYATELKAWQRKWIESINRTNEYESLLNGVRKILHEGELLCDLHLSVRGKLLELSSEIQQWRAQKYTKSLTKYKELRRSDEAFSKAQGPWIVKYKEVEKCMKSYHMSRHNLDGLNEQLVGLKSDKPETTQDQINKINSKIKKSELGVENWKHKYDNSIRDLTTYRPKYIQDMEHEFNNCQTFEKNRKEYTKEKLGQFLSYVDRRIFSENYEKIYSEIYGVHTTINVDGDLKWYCQMYGPDHVLKTVQYVEYDPSQFVNTKVETESTSLKENKSSSLCTTL